MLEPAGKIYGAAVKNLEQPEGEEDAIEQDRDDIECTPADSGENKESNSQ